MVGCSSWACRSVVWGSCGDCTSTASFDGSLLTGAGFNGVVRSVVALAGARIPAGGAFPLYAGFDRAGAPARGTR